MLACIPYTLAVGGFQNYTIEKETDQDEIIYKKSGADAEQSLGSIKIVKAFGREAEEEHKYIKHLEVNEEIQNSYSKRYGLSFGLVETLRYLLPCYFFLIGGIFIVDQVCLKFYFRFFFLCKNMTFL